MDRSESWNTILDQKAELLISYIGELQQHATAAGVDAATIRSICKPYLDTLATLYSEDYPLANALDNSDLVVRLRGAAVDKQTPKISIISAYFSKVRTQVLNIAKAIADLDASVRKMPKQFDLGLTAFARGSIVLGFSLPPVSELTDDNQGLLFTGDLDPLYKAAKDAMRTLGVVSQFVAKDESFEKLAEIVPDAKVRDIALSAVNDLAPSAQSQLSTVAIGGRDLGAIDDGTLTKASRSVVRRVLVHPVYSDEIVQFPGMIREIDLDAHRFELRHVENFEENELRCVYSPDIADNNAKKWLNNYVRVSGRVERDPSGKARLLEVDSIELDANNPES